MIFEEVAGLVATVGFPIVAFLLMYRMTNTTLKDMTVTMNELREAILNMNVKK